MSACRRRSPECAAGCMCLTYNWFYWCVCVFRSMVVVVADVVLVDYLDLVQCTGFAYATMESTNIREINQLNTQQTYEYVCICVCVLLVKCRRRSAEQCDKSDRCSTQRQRQCARCTAKIAPRPSPWRELLSATYSCTRAPNVFAAKFPPAGPHDPISATAQHDDDDDAVGQ